MSIVIYLCILVLNLAAIFMTYKFLGKEIEQKERLIFIAIGTAIIYVLVSLVYWLSTRNIDLGVSSQMGKNLITFTFVPINSIITLPFMAKSYQYFKQKRLKQEVLRNRIILIGTILLIVLIIEFFYFKDIQNGILSIIQAAQ